MKDALPASNSVKIKSWLVDNIVPVSFLLFTLFGFFVSEGVSLRFFLHELLSRFFRNIFLVLSLVIPVTAGLGLNFGIVIGAMAGQIAVAWVRFFNFGGISGLLLCFVISTPIAILFGYMTGHLYNKTKGQEMIASLIVGFFANGLYQFLFLYVIGGIIKVDLPHYMIKPDGVGVRATVDMGSQAKGGLQYALDGIMRIPLMWALFILSVVFVAVMFHLYEGKSKNSSERTIFTVKMCSALFVGALSAFFALTGSSLMKVTVPLVTLLVIASLCVFIEWVTSTKLGQDFRSVGHSQHIADVSGIDVNRKRILAVEISTVLAAFGQVIYLQDMGTLSTYSSHTQIGMFSVAALLVGGASISRANIWHAIVGTILFNAMFIMSPEIGRALFGQVLLGEYFRTFMVYGVIGVALGVYVWQTNRHAGDCLK